jgi:hypothetical protein
VERYSDGPVIWPVRHPGPGFLPDDSVMSASIWVPLVTATVGLAAGLITGLGGAVLTRRWAREDRAAAWQREDSLRWQADRLQTYTRLISALNAWDIELDMAMSRRAGGWDFDQAEWQRHNMAADELVTLVHLTAPEKVRDLTRLCYAAFFRAGRILADGEAERDVILAQAQAVRREMASLMEAMRADLGLGANEPPVAGAAPRPAE